MNNSVIKETEEDKRNEEAIKIITNNIAKLMEEYAFGKGEDKLLKEKIDVLEDMKERIYLNDKKIIDKVIENHRKGVI